MIIINSVAVTAVIMTTDSILPLTVDSAMAATLEPLDDPMIDLESILLSGDASVHQTDLLSGLIETDEVLYLSFIIYCSSLCLLGFFK